MPKPSPSPNPQYCRTPSKSVHDSTSSLHTFPRLFFFPPELDCPSSSPITIPPWSIWKSITINRASHEVQDQEPTSKPEDTMLNTKKVVLSLIPVRSVGRPRSKRRESKIDQVVKKLRAKKQKVATSIKNVPSDQKGRKQKGSSKSKNGQDNTNSEGHEVGGACFFPNEFQELQSNEPATPIHLKSYVDILQGKADVMDLLAVRRVIVQHERMDWTV